jgi:DNA-binding LacI/PurR family transcriptional regulator
MPPGKPEKFKNIASLIEKMISSENLSDGDSLPSERNMAAMFGVTQLTVRRALQILVEQGRIYKVPSKGNFVGKRPASSQGNKLIAFIIPENIIYFYNIFAAVESSLWVDGYHFILHISDSSQERERQILTSISELGVDAVVAAPGAGMEDAYKGLDIPLVFFDSFLDGVDAPYVVSDDREGAYQITKYLIGLGHKKIAHIGGGNDVTAVNRKNGWSSALKDNGVEVYEELFLNGRFNRDWGYYAAKELFSGKVEPTAIFCASDFVAAGAFRALRELRVKVPEDCSIVGFGDTSLAIDLSLTSVSQHSEQIAVAISSLLRDILQGKTPYPKENIIKTTPVIRTSSAVSL